MYILYNLFILDRVYASRTLGELLVERRDPQSDIAFELRTTHDVGRRLAVARRPETRFGFRGG